MQLCKKKIFSNVDHYISTHKVLNHETFCKQEHYHKLRLTNHCWFKWQPFLAMGQSARQECCSTQATSGLSMVLQSFRALSLAETMPQLPDGWASFIFIPPTCATTNTCAQKSGSAEVCRWSTNVEDGNISKNFSLNTIYSISVNVHNYHGNYQTIWIWRTKWQEKTLNNCMH